MIPRARIAAHLAAARVGLCLSAEEGPMYASIEYLLCGLPVVSTRSKGGRDVFFDPEYVEIVDDDAEAVRAGVEKMKTLNLDPSYIRNRTLQLMQPQREAFIQAVQGFYENEGMARNFAQELREKFTNRMLEWHRWSDIAARLQARDTPGAR